MRLGVFMAILATLLVDIGLVFPVVVETALPAGSEALAAGSLVRCFKVLTYQNHWYWPDSIRLIGRLFEAYYDNFFEVVTTATTRTRLVTLSSIPCPHSVMK